MDTSFASIRAWARRLLAAEVANSPASAAKGQEVVRVCGKLRASLTQFVGADGFTALLRRALALARVDVPSLNTVKVTADGNLEGIEKLATEEEDIAAAITITTHLLGLMVTFIGESLTLRLMCQAFPGVPDRMVEESEEVS
jgi:hypothetical protein